MTPVAANLSGAVSAVAAAAEKLRADDRLITDSGMLLGDVEALADTVTVLQSVLVDRIAEARRVGATVEHYGRSPRNWLAEDLLMAGPEASRYVNLAQGLDDFPLVREAFARARLSAAHVSEILKAMRWLPPAYRDQV